VAGHGGVQPGFQVQIHGANERWCKMQDARCKMQEAIESNARCRLLWVLGVGVLSVSVSMSPGTGIVHYKYHNHSCRNQHPSHTETTERDAGF
jgi:hypothetical protein